MKDFRKEEDGPCMDCDTNCRPGECVDGYGCNVCVDGFYRTRVDDLWPFDCVSCREQISNCARCKDGVFSEEPVQCEECDGNFVTNEVKDACVCQEPFQLNDATNTCVFVPSGLSEDSSGVAGVSITLDIPESSEFPLPQDINFEQISVQSVPFDAPTCKEGEFLAESGDVCIVCDPNCEAGSCLDYDGCIDCRDGFFGSTFLGTGPLKCRACSVQNCITCTDDSLDASSVVCVECSPGFEMNDGACSRVQPLGTSPVLSQSQPSDDQSSDKSSEQQDFFETNIVSLGPDEASTGSPDEDNGAECVKEVEQVVEDTTLGDDTDIETTFLPTEEGEVVTFLPSVEVDLSSEISDEDFASTLEPLPFEFAAPEPVIENNGETGNPAFDGIGVQGNVEVALDGESRPESPADTCESGQFVKKMDNSCETCDPNCAVGCVDFDGCLECNAGFFTARRDDFWPFECYECNIENCAACRNGNFDATSAQCDKCVAGFFLGEDGKSCNPAGGLGGGETIPDAQTAQQPELDLPISEQSIGEVCGEGRFQKEFDLECMDCDANCSPGYCVDRTGCDKCLEGFYRTRPDHKWPFACENCKEKISNCRLCRDGVFDAWPVLCAECEPTFRRIDGGAACGCEEGLRLNDRGDVCIPA
ncbi:hypothetical protein BSKO_06076 [Bryopsis sp. KO-2023]|nr:hypothetical protein BSKO_06076 [Bryopsis sp. KO-2023]